MDKSPKPEEIGYGQANFLLVALAALDDHNDVVVVVPPRLATVVERAKDLHDAYFISKKSGRRSWRLLFRFGLLGFRTPSLWAVLNKAELIGRSVKLERSPRGLVITLLAS